MNAGRSPQLRSDRSASAGLSALLPLLWLAVSCAPPPPSTPVHATPLDLTRLAGEWSGEYSTREGRSGYIVFRLDPGTEVARGDVFMYPETVRSGVFPTEELRESADVPAPIRVRFVLAEPGAVHGELEPYRDPTAGTMLRASFRGTWQGEVIEGRFESRDPDGRVVREGWWRVVRTGGAVAEGPPGPGLHGPSDEELVALGRQVFESRGCVECHGAEESPRREARIEAPALDAVVDHRTFPWIYHMVLRPDSMLRDDTAARELLAEYGRSMPDLDVTPWEALLLYEYLVQRATERPSRSP